MESKIKEALEISIAIDQVLNGLPINRIDSCLIPVTFFATAIEHQKAVAVLTENGLYGSAASLLRSIFESYVKGLWFQLCAKEPDFKRLRNDKFEKKIHALIMEIDEVENKGLIAAKKEIWSVLNSLTHSGLSQLSRRIREAEIAPNYDAGFIRDVLRIASNYGFLSCIRVASISGKEEAIIESVRLSKKFGFPR